MADRDYDNPPVGRKVTAFHENGWFTGTIHCLNKVLKEIKHLIFSPSKILITWKMYFGTRALDTFLHDVDIGSIV